MISGTADLPLSVSHIESGSAAGITTVEWYGTGCIEGGASYQDGSNCKKIVDVTTVRGKIREQFERGGNCAVMSD